MSWMYLSSSSLSSCLLLEGQLTPTHMTQYCSGDSTQQKANLANGEGILLLILQI